MKTVAVCAIGNSIFYNTLQVILYSVLCTYINVFKAIVSYLLAFKCVLNHQKEMDMALKHAQTASVPSNQEIWALYICNRGTPLAFPYACAAFACMYARTFTFATHLHSSKSTQARNRRKSNNRYIVVLWCHHIRKYKNSQIDNFFRVCIRREAEV